MESTVKYHVVVALFFAAIIVTPMVTQHCLALEHLAIEWSSFDDSEKESSKKLLDDFSKDFISYGSVVERLNFSEELSRLNAGYLLNPQQLMVPVILDPPERNKA